MNDADVQRGPAKSDTTGFVVGMYLVVNAINEKKKQSRVQGTYLTYTVGDITVGYNYGYFWSKHFSLTYFLWNFKSCQFKEGIVPNKHQLLNFFFSCLNVTSSVKVCF